MHHADWLAWAPHAWTARSVGALPNADYWKMAIYFGALLLAYLLFSLPMSYLKHNKVDWVNTEELKWVLGCWWLALVVMAVRHGPWVSPAILWLPCFTGAGPTAGVVTIKTPPFRLIFDPHAPALAMPAVSSS